MNKQSKQVHSQDSAHVANFVVNWQLILFIHLTSSPSILFTHHLTPPFCFPFVPSYNPFCMKPKLNLVTAPTHNRFPVCYWSPRLQWGGHCHLYPLSLSLSTQSFKAAPPLESLSVLFTFPSPVQLTSVGPDYPILPLFLTLSIHFSQVSKGFFLYSHTHWHIILNSDSLQNLSLHESSTLLFSSSSSCFSYIFIVQSPHRTHTLLLTVTETCRICSFHTHTLPLTHTETHLLMGQPGQPFFYIVQIKQMLIYFIYYIGQFIY